MLFAFPPTAPANIEAVAISKTEIQLSWDPPLSDQGSKVTEYRVFLALQGLIHTTEARTFLFPAVPGESYEFSLEASNALGQSVKSAPVQALAALRPSSPTNLTLSDDLVLQWEAPVDDGGSPIISYLLSVLINTQNY